MLKTKSVTMAVLALVGVLAAGAAQADVVYTFAGTGPSPGSFNGIPFVPTLNISLDIRDAAVTRGSFTLSGGSAGSNPADFSGDLADWVSITSDVLPVSGPVTIDSRLSLGQFRLALTFDPTTEAVTSTSFESAFDSTGNSSLSGTGSFASGTYGNDAPSYALCDPRTNTCPISGTWTESATPNSPVPEPATFAVLGVGLVGLAAARRRST